MSILAYADDVALLAENEADLKQLLQELHIWCETNTLEINANK